MVILLTILVYFVVLLLFSRLTARRSTNEAFYRGNRRSPWYMVAFGMVGASISGVTFVSVPGMVISSDMTYMQTCLGFILGYFLVAFLLLPVYYKLNLTTIYSYLGGRLGERSYKTGAAFFLLSKMTGATVRFYVVCMILQRFVLDAFGVPFWLTVLVLVGLIWLYTRRGGIKTLVWTDGLQTTCMFTALFLIIYKVTGELGFDSMEAVRAIASDTHSHIFVFDDWVSRQNFWKQFLSGIFIVIVMTGLDQDMMQKNLTCKTLREAQKDMCTYGFAFVPANLLFMSLGVLLLMLAQQWGMAVDICGRADDEKLRRRAHIGVAMVFALFIILIRVFNSTSLIDAVYILCSYTYGPLLGLFAFGLLTHREVEDKVVPWVCLASPLICFALDKTIASATGYHFGYELLMLNGLLTFIGLWWSRHLLRQV